METKRPIGVTIIAILIIIGGIFLLLEGIILATLGPIISQLNVVDNNSSNSTITLNVNGTTTTLPKNTPIIFLGGYIAVVGGIFIAIAIACFVVAWGLLKGKGWAWIVTLIITIISIIADIVSLIAGSFGSIGGLIINGVIIYYLYRPSVKAYFGRIKGQTV